MKGKGVLPWLSPDSPTCLSVCAFPFFLLLDLGGGHCLYLSSFSDNRVLFGFATVSCKSDNATFTKLSLNSVSNGFLLSASLRQRCVFKRIISSLLIVLLNCMDTLKDYQVLYKCEVTFILKEKKAERNNE